MFTFVVLFCCCIFVVVLFCCCIFFVVCSLMLQHLVLMFSVFFCFCFGNWLCAVPLFAALAGYTKGAVTQNIGEKGVSSVLDYVSSSNDWNLLKGFYEQTLDTLR